MIEQRTCDWCGDFIQPEDCWTYEPSTKWSFHRDPKKCWEEYQQARKENMEKRSGK